MGKLISIDSIEEPGLASIERISAIQAAGGMSPSFTNLLALLVLGSEIYVVGCHWKMSQTCVLSIGSLTSISILRKSRRGKATKEAYDMDPG